VLLSPEKDAVTRVLAANWLAEADAARAPAALAKVAQQFRQGQLLTTCLELMTHLKAAGLERHAAALLPDRSVPLAVRQWSALYLGTVQHSPAVSQLASAAAEPDATLAACALAGLRLNGSAEAVRALLTVLAEGRPAERQEQAAAEVALM
jgi:hypothetical protein